MKWFKHDANASRDTKLKKLRIRYGMEGYGLYWYCLELIADKIDQNNLTFEIEDDAEIIAHDTGIHRDQVEEMMRYMVTLSLFEVTDSNVITCMKMAKRLDQSMTSNTTLRKALSDLSVESHDPVMIESCKKRREENRREEKTHRRFPPSVSEVQEYLDDKKITAFTGQEFCDFYNARNWMSGKTKIVSWQHCVGTWRKNNPEPKNKSVFKGGV